jgi:glycosyltransferase involved in cell wall biosynthesis
VRSLPGGSTDAEREFAPRLIAYDRAMANRSWRARMVEYDVENTKKLDAILAISEFGRGNVSRVYGRNDATVVYPIVRFPAERPRSRSGRDRTGLKILTHSRLEIPKNVDTVVRAFALLVRDLPGSLLHVVGEGNHRKRLEKLVQELALGSSVRFHGYLLPAELDRVYDACDVFALLPLDEPFGLVFPEAAARGLLLVGPEHGGPFEILDGGRLGWTCDPFAPEAVADAFRQIARLSDAEVDARRVEADRACRSRYSEAVIGPQLLRALGDADRTSRPMVPTA